MYSPVVELAIWLVLCPIGIGAFTAARLRAAKRKAGQATRFTPSDRFEVLNDVFGAAGFFCPMAVGYAFMASEVDLPNPQWWLALIGLCAVGSLPLLLHSKWSMRRRAALKLNEAGGPSPPDDDR